MEPTRSEDVQVWVQSSRPQLLDLLVVVENVGTEDSESDGMDPGDSWGGASEE